MKIFVFNSFLENLKCMYLVYCPFPNIKEARKISKTLVELDLCCCVNILKSYSSIYKWKGKIVVDSEFVLIAKVQEKTMEEFEKKLKALHPYEIPSIIKIKIDKINKEYEQWCRNI